jgi:hypothetical protein
MRHPQAILTLAAILALTSAGPPQDFQSCTRGAFEGITQTTGDGAVVGEPDPRDWGCVGGSGAQSKLGASPRGRVAPLGVPAPTPTAVCMFPAYPNPADAGTWFGFTLPAATHASLSIYSRSVGHGPPEVSVVRTLMDADLVGGTFAVMWDLKDDHGARVAAGIYRAVLVVGDEALCGDIEVH